MFKRSKPCLNQPPTTKNNTYIYSYNINIIFQIYLFEKKIYIYTYTWSEAMATKCYQSPTCTRAPKNTLYTSPIHLCGTTWSSTAKEMWSWEVRRGVILVDPGNVRWIFSWDFTIVDSPLKKNMEHKIHPIENANRLHLPNLHCPVPCLTYTDSFILVDYPHGKQMMKCIQVGWTQG